HVEHHVARLACEGLDPVGLTRQCAVAALHVELALDDDEFLVRLARPTVPRVHDDRQVHPLHQVKQDRRRSAVHEIGAWVTGDELEGQRVVRDNRAECLVHRNARRVKIDRVRHRRFVDEQNEYYISLTNSYSGIGYLATKTPAVLPPDTAYSHLRVRSR